MSLVRAQEDLRRRKAREDELNKRYAWGSK